jgi:hypothetical protein
MSLSAFNRIGKRWIMSDIFELEYCPGCGKTLWHMGSIGYLSQYINKAEGRIEAIYGLCTPCSARITNDRRGRQFIKRVSARVEADVNAARQANAAPEQTAH